MKDSTPDPVSFQVTVNRVVNIGQRGLPFAPPEYNRDYAEDEWYDDDNWRENQDEDDYPPSDRRYYDDGPYFHRISTPAGNVREA